MSDSALNDAENYGAITVATVCALCAPDTARTTGR